MSEDKELSDKDEFEDLTDAHDKTKKAKIERDQERAENDSNRIETKVEKDQEQANNDSGRIETLENEKSDLKDKMLRLQADNQNLLRQKEKQMNNEINKNKYDLLKEFIIIYENLIRAENSFSKNDNVDTSGIELIRKDMEKILSKNNITPIDDIIGKPFDSQIHDGVSVVYDDSVDDEAFPNGIITEEVSKGYYAEKRILKPSKVIVSKKKN
jgi:molecular chaperone GrpE